MTELSVAGNGACPRRSSHLVGLPAGQAVKPRATSPRVAGVLVGPVLIVDEHELFRTSLRVALRAHGLDAHEASSACWPDIQAQAGALPAGVVTLDIGRTRSSDGLPECGSDLVRSLREMGWHVLVVSAEAAPGNLAVAAAIAAGAVGVVHKSSPLQWLLDAVRAASAGEQVLTENERRMWLAIHRDHQTRDAELSRKVGRLSPREREVLDLMTQGHRASSIAETFMVSMTTVRTQIRSILTKLEVDSQLEAVAVASKIAA